MLVFDNLPLNFGRLMRLTKRKGNGKFLIGPFSLKLVRMQRTFDRVYLSFFDFGPNSGIVVLAGDVLLHHSVGSGMARWVARCAAPSVARSAAGEASFGTRRSA